MYVFYTKNGVLSIIQFITRLCYFSEVYKKARGLPRASTTLYYLVKVYVGVFNSYLLFRFRDYLVVRHHIGAHAKPDSIVEDDVKEGEPVRTHLLLLDERTHYGPDPLFSGCCPIGNKPGGVEIGRLVCLAHNVVWFGVVGGWWW